MAAASAAKKTRKPKAAPPAATTKTTPEELAAELEKLRAELDEVTDVADGPVEIGKEGRSGDSGKLVLIFTSRGEEFGIPAEPNPAILMRFLKQCQDPRIGTAAATTHLMLALLGPEALDELADNPDCSPKDVGRVFDKVTSYAFDKLGERFRRAAGNS